MARRQFGNKEQVTGGTLKRTKRRLKSLGGGTLAGVDLSNGITGAEARKVKSASKGYTAPSRRKSRTDATFTKPLERVGARGPQTNNVTEGGGASRRGGKFVVRWSPEKKRFVHVYKGGDPVTGSKRKEVTIRKGNPLTAQYRASRKRKNQEKISG